MEVNANISLSVRSSQSSSKDWTKKGRIPGRGITFTWFAGIKTLIIEVPGVFHEKAHSEFERALTCLRADAKWWLAHSQGGVNIVMILWIRPERKVVQMEKWCLGQAPATQSSSSASPTMVLK